MGIQYAQYADKTSYRDKKAYSVNALRHATHLLPI